MPLNLLVDGTLFSHVDMNTLPLEVLVLIEFVTCIYYLFRVEKWYENFITKPWFLSSLSFCFSCKFQFNSTKYQGREVS